MSKKSFKIARKPGQGTESPIPIPVESETKTRARKSTPVIAPAPVNAGATTRKTIEVPEDYFFQVKMRALQRRILEKDLWAEILNEYFQNHPTL